LILNCIQHLVYFTELKGNMEKLFPLAIQLEETNESDKIFFSPSVESRNKTNYKNSPEYITWTFAKMHLASSDGQMHEMVSHLGLTHLVMEPIVISTMRNLPKTHPIFKVVYPHTIHTLAINQFGRETLLNIGGFFDSITSLGNKGTLKLIEKVCNGYNFTNSSFPEQMESRGFKRKNNSIDILPGYLYRDFGFMIWDVLEEYVKNITNLKYKSNKQVEDDEHLQNWAKEIEDENWGNLAGFPKKICSKVQLIETLTNIIFTASAQHSAVNFGQYDFYSFVPFRPLSLTKIMPKKGVKDWKYVMDALPNCDRSIKTIIITNILAAGFDKDKNTFSPDLKNYSDIMFEKLEKLEEEMKKISEKEIFHYRYLYPSQVSLSIDV